MMGGMEIAAAMLGVVNVALVVRRSIWNYPFGLAMVAFYFFVFWDAKLYSDALLQIFFFAIQIVGWIAWSRAAQVDDGVAVGWMSRRAQALCMVATVVGIATWGTIMARYTDAAAPLADAAVAGLSVSAQIHQSLRRVESWMFWIAVDALAIGVFTWRGLGITAALYSLFLVMAVVGFIQWQRKVSV